MVYHQCSHLFCFPLTSLCIHAFTCCTVKPSNNNNNNNNLVSSFSESPVVFFSKWNNHNFSNYAWAFPHPCARILVFKMTVVCRSKMNHSVLIQNVQPCLHSKIFLRPLGTTFTDLFVCLSGGDHRVSIVIALLRT